MNVGPRATTAAGPMVPAASNQPQSMHQLAFKFHLVKNFLLENIVEGQLAAIIFGGVVDSQTNSLLPMWKSRQWNVIGVRHQ